MTTPNHALQRTRRERRGCNRSVPWAGSLSLGRSAKMDHAMSTERVKCAECDNMILPATAGANAGLCAQCMKISPRQREESRAFDAALEGGELWQPSEAELLDAQSPPRLANESWRLEPEFYAEEPGLTVADAVRRASVGEAREVFLVSDAGNRLLVSLNSDYGVCEYQNEEDGDWRYAYSDQNLASQVPEPSHLSQPCACCGVGMGWYPSRTHMPRTKALEILSAIATPSSAQPFPEIRWLELGDISRYHKGRG